MLRGLGTVSSLTAVSRVLGLIRDAGMAVLFGAGPLMDAFTVAFRLPNLARRLFGEGALTAAFLPVFVREHQADEVRGRELAWAVTTLLTSILLLLTAALEAGLLGLLMTTDGPADVLLKLAAILTPYLIFICVAAQLSAVLHALRRFFWPALLPLVLNAFWIAAIFAAPLVGDVRVSQMTFICVAISLSGVVQVSILLVVLRQIGFRWAWAPRRSAAATREIAAAIVPTMIGLSITQLNAVADSLLAWGLSPSSGIDDRFQFVQAGAATALYLGQRVHQVPLGVFGIALSTVLFPVFAEHAQAGRTKELGRDITLGIQLCLLVGVPASLGLVLLGREIPRLLFEYGAFDARSTDLTAQMLAGYGLGVWAFMTLPILNRGFFAIGDRLTPMRVGLAIVAVHLLLDLVGVVVAGGAGLAVATSVAAILQVAVVVRLVHRDVAPLRVRALARTAARVAAATIAMAVACRLSQRLVGSESRALAVVLPVAVSIVTYAVVAYLLRLHRIVRDVRQAKDDRDVHT